MWSNYFIIFFNTQKFQLLLILKNKTTISGNAKNV